MVRLSGLSTTPAWPAVGAPAKPPSPGPAEPARVTEAP